MSRKAVWNTGRAKYPSGARRFNYIASMGQLTKSFGLAMMGNEHMMEIAVQRSLDHWILTDQFDIVFLVLKLLKVCHAKREDLVLEVFDRVFERTGCFDVLFDDVVFGTSEFPSKERLEDIEWYLTVAAERTFTYQNEVVPLIDLPNVGWTLAAHAASKARIAVLLLFLRYGANPDKAAALLSSSPPSEDVLRLILRAMPYPTPNILKIEPTLVLVPRLKHLCKIVVRNVLIKDIPKAIYDLPIPFELMEYLDLLKDF